MDKNYFDNTITSYKRRAVIRGFGCCWFEMSDQHFAFTEIWHQPDCHFAKILLGAFEKLRKATVSFILCVSVYPSIRMEQLGSHWTDFH